MTHFIRQQFLHVDLTGSESEGFALQNQLTELYYTSLLPAIEKALDHCCGADTRIVIDRIDIDAGHISLERLGQDLPELISNALISSIQKSLAGIPLKSETIQPFNNRQELMAEQVAEGIYSNIRNTQMAEVLAYFLLNGSLPWSYKLPAGKTLEEVIAEFLIDNDASPDSTRFSTEFPVVLQSKTASERLLLQFSEQFILMLASKTNPDLIPEIQELYRLTERSRLTENQKRKIRTKLLEKLIVCISGRTDLLKNEIAQEILDDLLPEPELYRAASIALSTVLPAEIVPDSLRSKPGKADGNKTGITTLSASLQEPGKNLVQSSEKEFYIENAGLILLHPFLSRFFETLSISDSTTLLQPEKALAMLHHLATGQTHIPEYELLLPKILCNYLLSSPVAAAIEISESEQEEAVALLEAVIEHWEALRSTSRDGLRESFIMRPGKLSLKENGDWLLQVEPRAFDVLLNQLPWGISLIQLPWMKTMLWVEWNY